ncbi:MAG: endolytic transglycosylase MltG, partial [Patescibacteria group bacterium]
AINNSGYNLNQIITLASLLERETITNEERPVVAGILWKRVEAGWPLQVDAAVQYAIATADCQGKIECEWWPILTKEDLAINSSYNTYKYPGLPPAPIASPGLSSIKAAIFPEDSPYWFYLHDADGEIHYAETLEEHNANVSRYLGK